MGFLKNELGHPRVGIDLLSHLVDFVFDLFKVCLQVLVSFMRVLVFEDKLGELKLEVNNLARHLLALLEQAALHGDIRIGLSMQLGKLHCAKSHLILPVKQREENSADVVNQLQVVVGTLKIL